MALYVGSYFYLVRPMAVVGNPRNDHFVAAPGYGGVPSVLFIPIHWFDRTALRPGLWSGDGNEEDFERRWGWR